MQMKRKAFTLIELLVAISVLAILAGIIVFALGRAVNQGSANSTKTILANCVSLLEEYRLANNKDISPLFLTSPYPNPIIAPRSIVPSRTIPPSPAVLYTRRVMKQLLAIPANKRAVDSMPAVRLLRLPPDPADKTVTDIPVILDAWGNPILFIPCHPNLVNPGNPDGGLSNVKLGNGQTGIIRPTDSRPFFASAGADGNVASGDDNVYSFEN